MTPKKNAAAVALGKKRWSKIDAKTRSKLMRQAVLKRWNKEAATCAPQS